MKDCCYGNGISAIQDHMLAFRLTAGWSVLGQCKTSIKLARPPECLLDFARLRLLGTLDLREALSASSAFESEADAARVVRMLAHDTVRIMYIQGQPPSGGGTNCKPPIAARAAAAAAGVEGRRQNSGCQSCRHCKAPHLHARDYTCRQIALSLSRVYTNHAKCPS